MSKMMEALKKAEEAMKRTHTHPQVQIVHQPVVMSHEAEHSQEHTLFGQNLMQAAVIIVFLIIGVTSIIFNFTTVSELKKTKEQAGQLLVQVQGQQEQLSQFHLTVENLSAEHQARAQQVKVLERNMVQVQEAESLKAKEISTLANRNSALQSKLESLTSQNQSFSRQYKDLNEEVGRLKLFIQDIHTAISNPIPATVGRE